MKRMKDKGKVVTGSASEEAITEQLLRLVTVQSRAVEALSQALHAVMAATEPKGEEDEEDDEDEENGEEEDDENAAAGKGK